MKEEGRNEFTSGILKKELTALHQHHGFRLASSPWARTDRVSAVGHKAFFNPFLAIEDRPKDRAGSSFECGLRPF
jgi:hypothetical protein